MNARTTAGAFTLVELLIVLTILGILALIVVPNFTKATVHASDNALKDNLRAIRTQIELFRSQHEGKLPGFPGGDLSATCSEATLVAHLTQYTSPSCAVSATKDLTHNLGPYLPRIPVNPINGLATVMIANGTALADITPDGSTGWIYQPLSGRFVANLTGNGVDGNSYLHY